MEIREELVAPCSAADLFGWVDDLDRYPEWLELVTRTESDGDGAWMIDLRATVGPLARTKRLRMVRTHWDPPSHAVFERAEVDGRQHSSWRLRVDVESVADGARLTMGLTYDGRLFGPMIERVLRDHIDRARPRLLALASAAAEPEAD